MGAVCHSRKIEKPIKQQNLAQSTNSNAFTPCKALQPIQSTDEGKHQIIFKNEIKPPNEKEKEEDPDLVPPKLYYHSNQKIEEKEPLRGKPKVTSVRLNQRIERKFEETQLFGKTLNPKSQLNSKSPIHSRSPIHSKSPRTPRSPPN